MHIEDFFTKLQTSSYFKFLYNLSERQEVTHKTLTGMERHHIYPKSFEDGKIDEKFNLIYLSYEEHLKAHL